MKEENLNLVFFLDLRSLISSLQGLGTAPIVGVLAPHLHLPLKPFLHEHLVYAPADPQIPKSRSDNLYRLPISTQVEIR